MLKKLTILQVQIFNRLAFGSLQCISVAFGSFWQLSNAIGNYQHRNFRLPVNLADRHFVSKTLRHQDSSALVPKCLMAFRH